jgi:BASS family bile acid:Na+ symporter
MNELLQSISRWAMLAFLLASMLEVGLSLTVKEVLAPLKNVRLVVLSLVANFLVVPLLAFAIGKVVRLEQPFAIGLLLLGLAPGAPFIPKVVQLARANLAFATGLMIMLLIGTALDLPLLLPRIISGVKVGAWQIQKSLLLLMLLPLIVGLGIRAKFRTIPAWMRWSLGLISNVSGVLVLVLIVALNLPSVFSLFGTGAVFAGLLFVVLSVLTGWLFGGKNRENRVTLGIGSGLRNVAAALLVGSQNFKDPKVSVMVIVTALLAVMILLPTAGVVGRRVQTASAIPTLSSQSH